jgi:hypothetical protein
MGWTIQVSSPGRCKGISLSKMSGLALGSIQSPIQRSSEVKQQRHEAHHLLQFSATRPVCLQSTGCTFTVYYLSVLFSYLEGKVQHKEMLRPRQFLTISNAQGYNKFLLKLPCISYENVI